ncbi:MAG TPA: four-carbon acid sugar kinase family protein, partial [Syntrophobacteraceae bacterium]|nr:four-carbon acid sugar kinase family protein [Syntrophobacteraceae bacterium]
MGILADDLTGALDTGVQFREKGFATFVPLKFSYPFPDAPALVFNSESRHLGGEMAYEMVRRICKKLNGRVLYKKIDSTLRGNVGWEIEAMLDELGYKKAILAPSYPAQGRTVEDGILKVNGIPLHRTSFGKEFKDPLRSSSIPKQLEKEIGEDISHIGGKELSQVPGSLASRILRAEERIVLIDAKTSNDLRCIARAWILVKDEVLACGSAGLAKEIPVRSSPFTKKSVNFENVREPFLIVSGSRNQKTLDQLDRVIDRLCFPLVEPDLKRFTRPKDSRQEIDRLSHRLFQSLEEYPGAILSTSFQRLLPDRRDSVSTNLGKVAADV